MWFSLSRITAGEGRGEGSLADMHDRFDDGWIATWRRRIRQLFGLVPTLDLHGLGVKDALAETERFLCAARAAGEPVVRIVYGKGNRSAGGRGVLRDVVPHWLENEGKQLVCRIERLPDQSGADGSARVWLRLDPLSNSRTW